MPKPTPDNPLDNPIRQQGLDRMNQIKAMQGEKEQASRLEKGRLTSLNSSQDNDGAMSSVAERMSAARNRVDAAGRAVGAAGTAVTTAGRAVDAAGTAVTTAGRTVRKAGGKGVEAGRKLQMQQARMKGRTGEWSVGLTNRLLDRKTGAKKAGGGKAGIPKGKAGMIAALAGSKGGAVGAVGAELGKGAALTASLKWRIKFWGIAISYGWAAIPMLPLTFHKLHADPFLRTGIKSLAKSKSPMSKAMGKMPGFGKYYKLAKILMKNIGLLLLAEWAIVVLMDVLFFGFWLIILSTLIGVGICLNDLSCILDVAPRI